MHLYFQRLKQVPWRNTKGEVWSGWQDQSKIWSGVYFRIDEVEAYIRSQSPTKLSDTMPIKLASGGELSAWELLFLMPKRALSEGRNEGLCDVTRYSANHAQRPL